VTFARATNDPEELAKAACRLLQAELPLSLRLLGVRMTNLTFATSPDEADDDVLAAASNVRFTIDAWARSSATSSTAALAAPIPSTTTPSSSSSSSSSASGSKRFREEDEAGVVFVMDTDSDDDEEAAAKKKPWRRDPFSSASSAAHESPRKSVLELYIEQQRALAAQQANVSAVASVPRRQPFRDVRSYFQDS
jgi:impB/mucB/samB family C-terminal domain